MHSSPDGASIPHTSKDGKVSLAFSTTLGHLSTPLKPLQPLALKLQLLDLQLLNLQLMDLHLLDLQPLARPPATEPPTARPPALQRRKRGTGYWHTLTNPATEPLPSLLTSLDHNFICNHCENRFKNHKDL